MDRREVESSCSLRAILVVLIMREQESYEA
jgi:hypothetical protein